MERMGLVQRDFQHACYDLHAAGEALRGQYTMPSRFAYAAVSSDLYQQRRRRRLGAFQHQDGAVGLVGVGQVGK